MRLSTKYFGEIEYSESDILTFPRGLFAFEEEEEFLLLPFSGSDGTLLCLQSRRTPELAFVVMNPFALDSAYTPVLQPEELEELGVEHSTELCYYVLCVVQNPVSSSTVNMKCPVVINDNTRQCIQVILDSDDYGMRHLLADFQKEEG